MSKIGKKPIQIPEKVEVGIEGNDLIIKGPKGELVVPVHYSLNVKLENDEIVFTPKNGEDSRMTKFARSMWGTTASLAGNAVKGVTDGFEKKLELVGVGYRANLEGSTLVLNLGYSHPVKYDPPEGIEITVEKSTITVQGVDKALVGQVAAKIRSFRKPEPYKGKGVKYKDEVIRRKAGKKVVGAGA